jgi:hypothetical protein
MNTTNHVPESSCAAERLDPRRLSGSGRHGTSLAVSQFMASHYFNKAVLHFQRCVATDFVVNETFNGRPEG